MGRSGTSDEGLVEEPGPAAVSAGRLASDPAGDLLWAESLQRGDDDAKIDGLVLQREPQIGEWRAIGRVVPGSYSATNPSRASVRRAPAVT